ncbi:MAG: hypothetical protein ACO3UU_06685 [Minisyncoccia bacterium]
MNLEELRAGIFSLACDTINDYFDPDDHRQGQKYSVMYGDVFCKLIIYRNCFEPCMNYDTYFEDFHVLYSNVLLDEYIQTDFYINRDEVNGLVLPDKKFKIHRAKCRKKRRP